MEELQKKHRQQQKDLQARITQIRKSATKKTRKGVNDECAKLERGLKERQQNEIIDLSEEPKDVNGDVDVLDVQTEEPTSQQQSDDISDSIKTMSVSEIPASNGHAKKPNRQKARLARRAAEQQATVAQAEKEADDLPNLRDQERKSMREAYTAEGLTEHEIRSDGHCLYAAIADQLQSLDISLVPKFSIDPSLWPTEQASTNAAYRSTRQVAAAFMSLNSNDFEPFLEEPLQDYVKKIRDTGEWGGHLEILALAKAYGVDVKVLRGNGKVEKIESGVIDPAQIWLAYYRHSFGLGEHYNSLRKAE
ncbi:hypothetical protein MMC21_001710 [Puttea exsequens]|nr:hypothetical protein [Puttea exsequens]